jgi:hypothetical protein
MTFLKKLVLTAALAALAYLSTGSVFAQSGPLQPPAQPQQGGAGPIQPGLPQQGSAGPIQPGQSGPIGPGQGGQAQAPTQTFTDASLVQWLRNQGFKVEERPMNDGRILCLTTIERDGWRFTFEIFLSADRKTVSILSHVGNPLSPGKATPDTLLKLLELNPTLKGSSVFFYRPADHRMLIGDWYSNVNQDPNRILTAITNMCADLKNTYPVWNTLA